MTKNYRKAYSISFSFPNLLPHEERALKIFQFNAAQTV